MLEVLESQFRYVTVNSMWCEMLEQSFSIKLHSMFL